MSKDTLPKELEQQFDELLKPLYVIGSGYFEKHSGQDSTKELENIKDFIATAVAQAEERVKQQVLELIGEDENNNKHTGHEIDEYYCIICGESVDEHPDQEAGRNELRQQLREKVSSL